MLGGVPHSRADFQTPQSILQEAHPPSCATAVRESRCGQHRLCNRLVQNFSHELTLRPNCGLHCRSHLRMGLRRRKDPYGTTLDNKFGLSPMPLGPWSVAHKFNIFILKKNDPPSDKFAWVPCPGSVTIRGLVCCTVWILSGIFLINNMCVDAPFLLRRWI